MSDHDHRTRTTADFSGILDLVRWRSVMNVKHGRDWREDELPAEDWFEAWRERDRRDNAEGRHE